MLQDFEITNNWDLGFYGYEGDVGARCLSLSHWISGEVWVGKHMFFLWEKWQKKQTRIHTCAIKRIIIMCSILHNNMYICLNTYLHIVYICTCKNHRNHFCIKICIIETRK